MFVFGFVFIYNAHSIKHAVKEFCMTEFKLNLQSFADGGATGGSASAEASAAQGAVAMELVLACLNCPNKVP